MLEKTKVFIVFAALSCLLWQCKNDVPESLVANEAAPEDMSTTPVTATQAAPESESDDVQLKLDECLLAVEACEQQRLTLSTELASAKQSILEKDQEIQRLKETPEQKLEAFVTAVAEVDSVEDVDKLKSELTQFISVQGTSAVGKRAKAELVKLEKRSKEIAAAKAEEDALAAIKDVKDLLSTVNDGTDLDIKAVFLVATYFEEKGITLEAIKKLPRVNLKEALKDPDSERGKSMVVKGKVIQIQKDGPAYTGLLATFDGYSIRQAYKFVTFGTTKDIYEQKSATFVGVFTQMYYYSTRSGGQNDAVVLVGFFTGQ